MHIYKLRASATNGTHKRNAFSIAVPREVGEQVDPNAGFKFELTEDGFKYTYVAPGQQEPPKVLFGEN